MTNNTRDLCPHLKFPLDQEQRARTLFAPAGRELRRVDERILLLVKNAHERVAKLSHSLRGGLHSFIM